MNKLGSYFDRFFKLAKASSNLEDLGKENLRLTLLDTFPGLEDHVADGFATLLITLVLQLKG